jgi:hypothetical protein
MFAYGKMYRSFSRLAPRNLKAESRIGATIETAVPVGGKTKKNMLENSIDRLDI